MQLAQRIDRSKLALIGFPQKEGSDLQMALEKRDLAVQHFKNYGRFSVFHDEFPKDFSLACFYRDSKKTPKENLVHTPLLIVSSGLEIDELEGWIQYGAQAIYDRSQYTVDQTARLIAAHSKRLRPTSIKQAYNYSQQTVENSKTGIAWIDLEGRIIYANNAFESITGYTASELSQLDTDVIDKEIGTLAASSARPSHLREKIYLRKTGDLIDVEVDFRWINSDNKRVLAIYLRDITHRKAVEREVRNLNRQLEELIDKRTRQLTDANSHLMQEMLKRGEAERLVGAQKRFLASILEKMPVGIYVMEADKEFAVSVWNAEMESMFKTSKEEAIGSRIETLFKDAGLQHALGELRKEDFSSKVVVPDNQKGTDQDTFIIDVTKTSILDNKGDIIAYVGIVQDVTDRINSENRLIEAFDELEDSKSRLEESNMEIRKGIETARKLALDAQASNQAKTLFMSKISHELKTPLNSIIGMTQVLLEKTYGKINHKQSEFLTIIDESGKHLQSLITDILDLSRIEQGKVNLNFTPTSPNEIANVAIKMLQQQAIQGNVKCKIEKGAKNRKIEADPKRLRQILLNLLSNAIKFTKSNTTVSLSINYSKDEERVEFQVKDYGIGIQNQDIDQLFKPFSQLDNSLSRKYEGTGLGLAIVFRLVGLHGGSLSVQSKLGKGSTFGFTLPVSRKISRGKKSRTTLADLSASQSKANLAIVIDENETIAMMESDITFRYGFSNSVVALPNELSAYSDRLEPDIVIVDLATVRNQGLEWIQQTMRNKTWKNATWVATTSLDIPSEKNFAKSLGIANLFPKPLTITDIKRSINRSSQTNERSIHSDHSHR